MADKIKDTYTSITKQYSRLLADDLVINCGMGWLKLISDLLSAIDLLIPEDGSGLAKDFKITKIYKKFGVLMIEVEGETEIIKTLVEFCERMSYNTCEICGDLGKLYCSTKWLYWSEYRTLCKDHAIKYYYYEIVHPKKGKK
jgi:hypothetical protein